jgi:uncharacterized protein Yka (UPF0111/DUF47 family)
MNEKQIQKLKELNRKALKSADEAIKSLDEVRRTAQRLEELHKEELRRAESRRPGIFRALFQ